MHQVNYDNAVFILKQQYQHNENLEKTYFTLLFKTRQDKTIARQGHGHGQDRTGQDRTGQNKTRQDKTRQDNTSQDITCGTNVPSKLSISTGLLVMVGDMTINLMPSPSTLVPNNPLTVTRETFACQYAMLNIKISYQI